MGIKKWFLVAKSRLLAMKNYGPSTKLERLKGAKCRCCSQKWTKNKLCKAEKRG